MLRKTLISVQAVVIVLCMMILLAPVASAYENTSALKDNANLLKDGDFESVTKPTEYGQWNTEHSSILTEINAGNAHSGKNNIKLVANNQYGFIKQDVAVEKNTYYAFEAYVKAEGNVELAIIGVWGPTKCWESLYKAPAKEYKKVVHYFYSGNFTTVTPFINLRGAKGNEAALIVDDAKLYKVELKDIQGDNLLQDASFKAADENVWKKSGDRVGFDNDNNLAFDVLKNAWIHLNKPEQENYYELYQDVEVEKNTNYTFSFYTRVFGGLQKKSQVKGIVETVDGKVIEEAKYEATKFENDPYRLITVSFNSGENTKVRLAMGVARADKTAEAGAHFDGASLYKLATAPVPKADNSGAETVSTDISDGEVVSPETGDTSNTVFIFAIVVSILAAIGVFVSKKVAVHQ